MFSNITAILILLTCVYAITASGKAGLSRFKSESALKQHNLELATQAVELQPSDPQAYYSRAMISLGKDRVEAAVEDFWLAVTVRPYDYNAWFQLGYALERKGDLVSAIDAYKRSTAIAPHYAKPHWNLGELLLRVGQKEQGFSELSLAARSDPLLIPKLVDRAWHDYEGNTAEIERVVRPDTTPAVLYLISFFVERGEMPSALRLLRQLGPEADYTRHVITVQLIEKRRYRDAADVWRTGAHVVSEGVISDGSFESGKLSEAAGFYWQKLSSEAGIAHEAGDKGNTLSLTFHGTEPATEFAKQPILLKPHTHYSLSFDARSQLVSQCLPVVAIVDQVAGGKILATSQPFSNGTDEWQRYTTNFHSGETNSAYLMIQRQLSSNSRCRISGKANLDNFVLTSVDSAAR